MFHQINDITTQIEYLNYAIANGDIKTIKSVIANNDFRENYNKFLYTHGKANIDCFRYAIIKNVESLNCLMDHGIGQPSGEDLTFALDNDATIDVIRLLLDKNATIFPNHLTMMRYKNLDTLRLLCSYLPQDFYERHNYLRM